MKITKIEKNILEYLYKNKKILFLIFITIMALSLRVSLYNIVTGDYNEFLKPWFDKYVEYGGIAGLKYNIGDYNCFYNYILSLLSYFPINSLYLIKTVSVLFDFLCAIFGYKIIKNITNNENKALLTYFIILILPTVVFNSGAWAQCDSIYTFFALVSIYYLLKDKYILSFIFAGISFSFKLQFIFLLPVYIIHYVREKKISILNFFIIPIVNIISVIPAVIIGRSFKDVLLIYFKQAGSYSKYSLNFPNIYYILGGNQHLKYLGFILCIIFLAILVYFIISKKIKLNKNNILLLCALSPIVMTFFLPYMHDRYMFMSDIFSILWFISQKEKKYIYFPVAINFISLIVYLRFLFGYILIDLPILSVIYLLVLMKFIYDLYINLKK